MLLSDHRYRRARIGLDDVKLYSSLRQNGIDLGRVRDLDAGALPAASAEDPWAGSLRMQPIRLTLCR